MGHLCGWVVGSGGCWKYSMTETLWAIMGHLWGGWWWWVLKMILVFKQNYQYWGLYLRNHRMIHRCWKGSRWGLVIGGWWWVLVVWNSMTFVLLKLSFCYLEPENLKSSNLQVLKNYQVVVVGAFGLKRQLHSFLSLRLEIGNWVWTRTKSLTIITQKDSWCY